MGRTVAELETTLSYQEFREWGAYYQLEPWGEERADLRMGIETSSLVRLWADPKKAKKIKPTDFMPFYEAPKKQPKSPEQMRATFDALMSKAG